MKTKVGTPAWADDPLARFAVAVPGAIVITALCFALARCQPAESTLPERTVATTVVLEHAAPTPPPPTPRPTPQPTLPPVPRVTLAPIPQRAAPRAIKPSGGGHAEPVTHPPVAPKAVTVGGTGGGAGPGTGDGVGAGDAGGTGDGTGGTGSGAVNADAPCGYVEMIPFEPPTHRGPQTLEHVVATVTFSDGHKQSEEFPYPFSYTDPGADPWSTQNLPNNNFPAHVQLPPPGANVSRYSETIRYILNHTRGDGTTILQECPQQR